MFKKLRQISIATMTASILFTGLNSCGDEPGAETAAAPAAAKEEKASGTKVGETLKTEYFDVTVNEVKTSTKVRVNEFEELPEEAGNKYLVLDLTLKNTDNESRMMFNGTLIVKANGQEYKYEDAELVAAEGWGIIMDNINPLVTKKTKLVYKIPAELNGTAYYNPARADDDERINLGELK